MKVALLQLSAGSDKFSNLAHALDMSRQALDQGACWVLLPEAFNFRVFNNNKQLYWDVAETIPGPSTEPFRILAKKHKASFVLGSLVEKLSPQRIANTLVFINAQGDIDVKYRKIHLFEATLGDKIIQEADIFHAGCQLRMAQIEEWRLGFSICYDLRFGELYREYSRRGANVLLAPSCFTSTTGKAHWETLLRARAIENLSYVLAPNQVGSVQEGLSAYGHSMIVSPWGEIIASGSGNREEIVMGDMHIQQVCKARKALPGIIKNRRMLNE